MKLLSGLIFGAFLMTSVVSGGEPVSEPFGKTKTPHPCGGGAKVWLSNRKQHTEGDCTFNRVLKLHYNELMTFAYQGNNGAGFPLMGCPFNRRIR